MPRLIYTGDFVEIRYIFHLENDIFGGEFSKNSARLSLSKEFNFFKAHEDEFSVLSAQLEKINTEYTLFLAVVPWKTGFLSIPPFNLTNLVNFTRKNSLSQTGEPFPLASIPFIVELSPLEVNSLASETGAKSILPHSPPLLLPGTTALLVTLAVLAIVLFALLIFILLKFDRVKKFILATLYIWSLKRNSRVTVKKILQLQKDSKNIPLDKDFAENLQHILRVFLKKRFAYDFDSVSTKEIYPTFSGLLGGDLDENQEKSVEHTTEIFSRLEYIRFAKNAHFLSAKENTESNEDERISITDSAILLVKEFDDDSV